MKEVKEAIEAGIITYDDIVEYLESRGEEIIMTERLEILEKSLMNHPG